MSTSRIMQYINIAKLLMENGPQTINQMRSLLRNHNLAILRRDLDFLSESKIIIEELTSADLSYAITERGIRVLTFFKLNPSRATLKLRR